MDKKTHKKSSFKIITIALEKTIDIASSTVTIAEIAPYKSVFSHTIHSPEYSHQNYRKKI